jgi:hypothetical protein
VARSAPAGSKNAMVDLKEDFELAAEWRRAVAVEHPSDSRNLKAAAMLDQLDETVADDACTTHPRRPRRLSFLRASRPIARHAVPSAAAGLKSDLIAVGWFDRRGGSTLCADPTRSPDSPR